MHYGFTAGNDWEIMRGATLAILIATVLYESVCNETLLWGQTGWIPAYGENKGTFEKNIGFVAEF